MLLFFLYLSNNASSQNFVPFQKGFSYYYTLNSNTGFSTFFNSPEIKIYPYKIIESDTNQQGDSVFIFNKLLDTENQLDSSCIKKIFPSAFGYKITTNSKREIILFNLKNDSIYLKCLDTVHSSWTAFQSKNKQLTIKALIINKGEISIFDEIDSMVTFEFYAYDSNGMVIPGHPVNGVISILSHHHGFIKMPQWREFPYNIVNVELKGIISDDFKIRKGLTGFFDHEIYNFEVGDEFQTYYESRYFIDYSKPPNRHTSYVISKIIDKKINTDTTIYTISKQVWNKGNWSNGYSWDSVYNAVNSLKIVPDFSVKTFRNPDSLTEGGNSLVYFVDCGIFSFSGYGPIYYLQMGGCYSPIIDHPGYTHEPYYTGVLGNFYYYGGGMPNEGYNFNKLIFVKKGNKSFGVRYPYTLAVKENLNLQTPVIYPNPAYNYISITNMIHQSMLLNIISVTGVMVCELHVEQNKVVELPKLLPGIYFYTLSSKSQNTVPFKGKLLITGLN